MPPGYVRKAVWGGRAEGEGPVHGGQAGEVGPPGGEGWTAWFKEAEKSGIPALVKFARLKEKRPGGLVTHALHPISTGKLEGFNNRIKVAKRIGYDYRNEDYFFSLIRYIPIPSNRHQSHKKT